MSKPGSWGRAGLLAIAAGALVSCPTGTLKDGYFRKDSLQYRVARPDASWKQVEFADNDLAWVNANSPHVLAMNATCEDHGDPGLDVLTNHLLFGFTDKALQSKQTKTIDGREALLSNWVAKLDGVPVEIDIAVLKKNGCVHDFLYVSPAGRSAEHKPEFDRLLNEFSAEKV